MILQLRQVSHVLLSTYENCCMLNSSKDEYLKLLRSQKYLYSKSQFSVPFMKDNAKNFLQKLILESMDILCQKRLVSLSNSAAVCSRLGPKSFYLQSL